MNNGRRNVPLTHPGVAYSQYFLRKILSSSCVSVNDNMMSHLILLPFLLLYPFLFLGRTTALPHQREIRNSKTIRKDADVALQPRDLESIEEAFPAMANALEVMQSQFWDQSSSTWPTGIDWTRAVFNTHMSATLSTIANYQAESYQNEIDIYFPQVVSFYNGENAVSLTQQKYDDMQWVILEWLEAIKFTNLYSSINQSFDGKQYVPEFAHRARIFWDLASQGYNTTLCGGGMLWTDQLAPYKNAITNQLFIASSIGMYLYFPGDNNTNPSPVAGAPNNSLISLPPITAHDQRYLNAAITEYQWLSNSNMTNAQGLYADGFHITNWTSSANIGTGKCDARDESVYTYNQGVLLSGVRGLWDATGQSNYLDDGYTLVNNVITATGWGQPNGTWAGLGSDGILQDLCDVDGSCSQDAQAFKGIFFHHLTLFCAPLSMEKAEARSTVFVASATQAQDHRSKCNGYSAWVQHNAQAAYGTRNHTGVYGEWWDVSSQSRPKQPQDASDYRNKGIPQNTLWRLPSNPSISADGMTPVGNTSMPDPNERGRGRTVETQSGGLGVMRCLVQAQEEA